MGRLPSGDSGVERPAARGGAWERRHGARRRWPCVVKGPIGIRSSSSEVCLSTDVATAVSVATPVEASARSVAVATPCPIATRVVAVPFPFAMVSRRLRGSRQYLCCLECFPWPRLCVGVCPRAGLPLRTLWLLPLPGTSVLVSLLRVAPGYERARVGSPRERTLELRGKQPCSGVRREAAAWPDRGVACVVCSVAALSRPYARAEAGDMLASRVCVDCGSPLLAASGSGLVVVVTSAPGGFRSVFSRYRSSVLRCQPAVAPACVASRPYGVSGVRGGSACGPSTLWRSEVAVLAARRPRDSSSRELGVGRVVEAAVALCVVSSSESWALAGGFSSVFQFRAASQQCWADTSSNVAFLLLYLGEFEMADRRDWGGGGDDPEESTQHMIERIWESLTEIRTRMDQLESRIAECGDTTDVQDCRGSSPKRSYTRKVHSDSASRRVKFRVRRRQPEGDTSICRFLGSDCDSLPVAIKKVTDVSSAIVEKMGQAIRSRNLTKSGFSVVNGVWTKTSVAEDEPILGEAQDVQHEAVAVESEGPSAVTGPATEEAVVPRDSQEVAANREVAMETPVAQENVAVADSVRSSEDPLPTSSVASVLRQVLDSIHSTPVIQNTGGSLVEQIVASGHIEDSVLLGAPIQGEQGRIVEEAPIQGEQVIEKEAASQGAHSEDTPVNEEHIEVLIEVEEQVERRSLSKKIAYGRQKKFLKKVHLKPILKRLDDQGEILTSVQSAVSSVIVRHESMSNDISQISNAMKWFNKELCSMKVMVSEILKTVGPKDPTPQECEPSGQSEGNAGPSGPIDVELVELPSGPSVDAPAGPSGPTITVQPSKNFPIKDSDISQGSGPGEEILIPVELVAERADQAVAPEPPASSAFPTPAPLSPPTSSTAPPAPTTFKRPCPRSVCWTKPLPLHQKLELVVKAVAKYLRRKRKAPCQRCGRHEGLRTGFYPCDGLGC
ncbi:hypothetical protein Taro_014075 [Colocasia esculenta]|uniref:Uncharacterized protein n=1 Tax=Colocasia esculenta TaxID=4460 RepID=A0A843UHA5_COLES|nr:hypothetical protein [Colocasia esculenta]